MAFSLTRFLKLFAWTLLKGLALVVLIAGGCVFILRQQTRAPYEWEVKNQARAEADRDAKLRASAGAVSGISNKELQRLIADVYHVETSNFVGNDLLHITLPPGSDVQGTCQAIANVWAHRSGLPWVRVESWKGTQRLGQGTVRDGQMVRP